jgi:hypothetical protein
LSAQEATKCGAANRSLGVDYLVALVPPETRRS